MLSAWEHTTREALPRGVSTLEKAMSNDPKGLEGAWFNVIDRTHLYVRVIDGQLVAPYCFGGNNKLTSVFYDWKMIGEFWFARFRWFERSISGYTFLMQDSQHLLTGAWWGEDGTGIVPARPNLQTGVAVRWERRLDIELPEWAKHYFELVKREGKS
jgi:hypothetical protein